MGTPRLRALGTLELERAAGDGLDGVDGRREREVGDGERLADGDADGHADDHEDRQQAEVLELLEQAAHVHGPSSGVGARMASTSSAAGTPPMDRLMTSGQARAIVRVMVP